MSTLIHFVAFQDTESKSDKQKQQQVQTPPVTIAGTTTVYSDYEGWDEQTTRVSQNMETWNQLQCCSENTVQLSFVSKVSGVSHLSLPT